MAKQKTEKINFSKFFPDTTDHVVVSGYANSADDFDLTVKIGTGSDQVSFFISDWLKGDLASLKAIQEGVQKAIDFHQKALSLPKVNVPDVWAVWDNAPKAKAAKRVLKSTETAPKKKATAKK